MLIVLDLVLAGVGMKKNAEAFLSFVQANRGEEFGVSPWCSYDQEGVTAHGLLTGDYGPIHADPEWCKENTQFGGTILQGSLIISSLTQMARSLKWPDGDIAFRMNYGFDRIRIIQPIKTGANFRGRFFLKEAKPKGDKALLVEVEVKIEDQNSEKPALLIDWLFYIQFNS